MKNTKSKFIGKQCIVRVNKSGVHYGTVVEITDQTIVIKNYKRLWQWQTKEGISVDALANIGIASGKIACGSLKAIGWEEGCEIIVCTPAAIKTLESVK